MKKSELIKLIKETLNEESKFAYHFKFKTRDDYNKAKRVLYNNKIQASSLALPRDDWTYYTDDEHWLTLISHSDEGRNKMMKVLDDNKIRHEIHTKKPMGFKKFNSGRADYD